MSLFRFLTDIQQQLEANNNLGTKQRVALLTDQVKVLLQQGKKYEAVNLVQRSLRLSHGDALNYVDQIETNFFLQSIKSSTPSHTTTQRHTPTQRSRHTEIDRILREQQTNEQDGGGHTLWQKFVSLFQK